MIGASNPTQINIHISGDLEKSLWIFLPAYVWNDSSRRMLFLSRCHNSHPNTAIGVTIVQKIILHVPMFNPFLLIPKPSVAFQALLAFPILSSMSDIQPVNMKVLTTTWSYSETSLTCAGPSWKSFYYEQTDSHQLSQTLTTGHSRIIFNMAENTTIIERT